MIMVQEANNPALTALIDVDDTGMSKKLYKKQNRNYWVVMATTMLVGD